MASSRRLFLIDSYGFIFRAYHARARTGAPPMRTAAGLSTEAVFIFHNMLRKLITTQQPDYIAAVFESAGPTFREQEFAEYKANRSAMPEDLGPQIPWVRRTLEAMRIPILEFPGFEADDVIGTIARRASAEGAEVVIVSSDKDMLQLVNDRVTMLNPMKPDPPRDHTVYDSAKVLEFMGVLPERVADLLALKGDAIDNIPGAPGIGDKGARDLVLQFGPVETILDRASEVQRKMYRESLLANRDQVLLSKRLATIDCSVPIEWNLESVAAQDPDYGELRGVYRDLEFFSLIKELPDEPEVLVEPVREIPFESMAVTGPWAIYQDAGCAREGEGFRLPESGWPTGLRWVHDLKSRRDLLETEGLFDVQAGGFLLLAEPTAVSLEALSERFLRGKPAADPISRAEAVYRLGQVIEPQVTEQGLMRVYEEIDRPLLPVLARMEDAGIAVDLDAMSRLSAVMTAEASRLEASIFELAGHEFNINSPQQLGRVLFEELGLPSAGRSGKTKQASTAADVLEGLAAEHEIARLVLDYRQVTKLKSTYAESLPQLIRPDTGRVHTTFNPAGAATGRLSSTNPNLQNIPIRTELGREIRAAFVPRPGWKLVVADYSQIELRLLAHMSGDKVLVEAFIHGEDIHTRTAAEVFGVPPLMVNPDMRRAAKAVNFGIVYGQTPFGLAQGLGIPRIEAERYIASYFERYPGVRRFIDSTIAKVRQTGYAETLFGRRRPIPDMNSRNPNARGFAERTAVNTPLQGTAADLIKLAMIRIDGKLRADRWQAKMLLQVHDELVFEAPPEEAPLLAKMVKGEMEGAHRLIVPLVVDTGLGPNWRDAK
jgi:DNA polymerase-1